MSKWFAGIKTRPELKARYKELVKIHHPDRGGNEQNMKEINNEYDELFTILPDVAADGTGYHKDPDSTRERPEDFRDALAAVIRFTDLEIEICGSWIWLHGNTYGHKDEIKAAGYRYSANKKSWYWHGADYTRKTRKHFSMEEIRTLHGSEYVNAIHQVMITA